MKISSMEHAEALLEEYTDAVAARAAARIDAGRCGTRDDFRRVHKMELLVEEIHTKLVVAMSRLAVQAPRLHA